MPGFSIEESQVLQYGLAAALADGAHTIVDEKVLRHAFLSP